MTKNIPKNDRLFTTGHYPVRGSFTGHAKEIKQTINFSVLTDVRPLNETFSLERANEAYDKMMAASTRLRAVLNISESNGDKN
jgi:alcohol dehydrogenase, propanol-preferring